MAGRFLFVTYGIENMKGYASLAGLVALYTTLVVSMSPCAVVDGATVLLLERKPYFYRIYHQKFKYYSFLLTSEKDISRHHLEFVNTGKGRCERSDG